MRQVGHICCPLARGKTAAAPGSATVLGRALAPAATELFAAARLAAGCAKRIQCAHAVGFWGYLLECAPRKRPIKD